MTANRYTFAYREFGADEVLSRLAQHYGHTQLQCRCIRFSKTFKSAYANLYGQLACRSRPARQVILADLATFFRTGELPYYVKYAGHEVL